MRLFIRKCSDLDYIDNYINYNNYTATLIISNEEMNDLMKIIKSLEEFGLLIKGVSETIKNEAKEQKAGLLSMLLGTLDASLLGNLY